MALLGLIGFTLCAVMGYVTAYWSARMAFGLSYPVFLFAPAGIFIYLAAWTGTFLLFLYNYANPLDGGFNPLAAFSSIARVFILALPLGGYLACLLLRVLTTFFSATELGESGPSYREGDEALLRKDYAQAILYFNALLEKHPNDLGAILRLSRACEAAGKLEEAERVLYEARVKALPQELKTSANISGVPSAFGRDEQLRLSALTGALAGFQHQVKANTEKAREICLEVLPYLTNHAAAQPVKDRLAKLNAS